jgi:hypothetical protein
MSAFMIIKAFSIISTINSVFGKDCVLHAVVSIAVVVNRVKLMTPFPSINDTRMVWQSRVGE